MENNTLENRQAYGNRLYRKVALRATLMFLYIRAVIGLFVKGKATLWQCLTGQFHPKASHWVVTKILCFREPPRTDEDSYDLDFTVLDPSEMDLDYPETLQDQIESQIPPNWTDWKVEIRCTRGSKKRRLVVRRGETVDPLHELSERRDYMTVSATVMEYHMDPSDIDSHGMGVDSVTSRIDKYVVVPHRAMYARDIFPMDDPTMSPYTLVLKTVCEDRVVDAVYPMTGDHDIRPSCCAGFVNP